MSDAPNILARGAIKGTDGKMWEPCAVTECDKPWVSEHNDLTIQGHLQLHSRADLYRDLLMWRARAESQAVELYRRALELIADEDGYIDGYADGIHGFARRALEEGHELEPPADATCCPEGEAHLHRYKCSVCVEHGCGVRARRRILALLAECQRNATAFVQERLALDSLLDAAREVVAVNTHGNDCWHLPALDRLASVVASLEDR